MITKGEAISRIKRSVKANRQDAFLTDRFIYSLITKNAALLMKRLDGDNKLMGFNSVFSILPCVELVEVDAVESGCGGIKTGVTFMRTKNKMSFFAQGYWGSLIRNITSIDGSEELQPTNPSNYQQLSLSKNFKYNKTKYYWYLNDYLYFPNITWESVKIVGVLNEDESLECPNRQEEKLSIPDFLMSDIEKLVKQELGITVQLPSDQDHNNNSAFN